MYSNKCYLKKLTFTRPAYIALHNYVMAAGLDGLIREGCSKE